MMAALRFNLMAALVATFGLVMFVIDNENNLTLAVYGTKGPLRWNQENPNIILINL